MAGKCTADAIRIEGVTGLAVLLHREGELSEEPDLMEEAIQAWEGEGGAFQLAERPLIGNANQVEWAMQIKTRVNAEFDRVAKAIESVASKQAEPDRINTQAIIAILEEKRAGVMAEDRAGYFIHDWQELRDQVRQMLVQDSRYQALKAKRVARAGKFLPTPKLKEY